VTPLSTGVTNPDALFQICSFCYIGHKELDDAIARCSDLPVKFDIQYRPFLLCGVLETPVDKGEFFRSKLKNYDEHLKSVNEAAARVGVEM
jgi:predicted DsbA family dithiol-disulfide isomerase